MNELITIHIEDDIELQDNERLQIREFVARMGFKVVRIDYED